ncbi:MAG: serine protease [Actinomycetota bacterium]|nr:serine protease [Actinomycetota bacterium]
MKPKAFLTTALAAAVAALAPAVAAADDGADVHPGVMTFTEGAQCTSNFVFRDASGTYLGQAAHCSGTGQATDTNGCEAGSLPLGTPVEIDGATRPGTLAYSSWITMQQGGETNQNACAYNDFALVKVDPADVAAVDPTVPRLGGPTSVGGSGAMLGDTVFTYGNSSLRAGIKQLRPKQGVVVQGEGNGWSRTVYTVTPGVPGDSGSGFLSDSGQAIGTLSTLAIAPTPGSNGVADLRSELDYMRANSGFGGVQLVPGTKPFRGDLVGAILGG